MKTSRARSVVFAVLALSFIMEAIATPPPSKYDGLRDPFKKPDPKPNVGEPKSSIRSMLHGTWEDGAAKGGAKPNPSSTPTTPPDPLVKETQRWISIYTFVNAAWRPSLVYVAGEIKSVAIENATNSFRDIALAYFTGPGWAKSSLKFLGPKVVAGFFTFLSIIEPSELDPSSELDINSNIGPDSEKLRDYLKRLNDRTKKEDKETKVMWGQIPNDFRVPASVEAPVDVSTEEHRRRAIFSDQSLSKDQARLVLAKAAGGIYGDAARRFTEDWLWLYDEDRIRQEGLSQAAIDLFYEGFNLFRNFKLPPNRRKTANACLIQPPNWVGTPPVWACTLPYTDKPTTNCYCPTSTGLVVSGVPKRFARGMTCVIPDMGDCPMVHSEPLGTLCGCSGYPGSLGQIR